MSNQLTMKVGVAIFAALALVGALTMFLLSPAYPVGASGHSAERSFNSATVAPGGTVEVTIDVAGYGLGGSVTETLPTGFTYDSSSLASGDVTTDGQNVMFTLLAGTDSFTYNVTASMNTGSYEFSGTFQDFERENVDVGGADTVTVTSGATSDQSSVSIKGGAKAAQVVLSNHRPGATDVTMTITFETRNGVDNTPHMGDGIVIWIPADGTATEFTRPTNFSDSHVTVTQGGNDVGTVETGTSESGDYGYIEIGPGPAGGSNLEEDQTVTVEVNGLTNPTEEGTVLYVPIGQQEETGGDYIEVYPSPMVTVYDPAKSFTNACAKLVDGKLVVEFRTRRDHGKEIFNVTITPNSGDFAGIGSASAVVSDNNGAASDTRNPALPSNFVVTNYDMGEKNTVTISGLSDPFGFTGDRLVKIAEGTGYGATLVVDGPCFQGLGDATEADDTDAVLGKGNNKADAATKVELTGLSADNTDGIRGGDDIVITLPKFHIPASIDENEIIIEEADDNTIATVDYYGPPESVSVSGDKITLNVPRRVERATGTGTELNVIDGAYTILIKKSAGIRNPNSDGTQTITVQDQDAATANHEKMVTIISHISPDPTWVERGDTVTVTAKGINAAGDATVHLLNMGNFDDVGVLDRYDATNDIDDIMELETVLKGKLMDETLDGEDLAVLPALDRSLRDEGTAILDFDTGSSMFHAGAQDATRDPEADAKGTNILVVVDAGGNVIGHARLGLKPTVTLNLAEVQRTGRMGVTVSDWYYRDLTDIRVNGIQVRLPDPDDPDDSVEWEDQSPPTASPLTVVVPRRARLGTMEVVVSGTTRVKQGSYSSIDKHVQTVDVGFFGLTITPSTAVTDQVIRIEGTGFGETTCITSIMVGDERIREATTGDRVVGTGENCVRTDTDGALANSFHVPHNLKPNTYTVVITDALNRVGQGTLTVPKPAISLEPEASQRGSTVTVTGENFPAEDVIGVSYGADPVTVATTDTVGNWRATFKIPVDATIGNEYKVEAVSEKKGTGQVRVATGEQTVKLSAEATHTVPEEILMVEPATGSTGHSPEQISSGQRLRITASNLPLFTPVSLRIGGIGAAGRVIGEDDAADSAGRYERVILVPQLTPGIHTVELTVHNIGNTVVVVEFVEILDIITRPTVDVFEDLIAAGQLTSVWRYRIDESGSDWDSFDPQFIDQPGINDLETVSTRDIVWIRVTENTMFQGANLYAGWNLRTLE